MTEEQFYQWVRSYCMFANGTSCVAALAMSKIEGTTWGHIPYEKRKRIIETVGEALGTPLN